MTAAAAQATFTPMLMPPLTPSVPYGPLATLREMLGDIDATTSAGQLYVMRKVIAELQREITRRTPSYAELERRRIRYSIDELTTQVARIAPDVEAFIAKASRLIDLLSG